MTYGICYTLLDKSVDCMLFIFSGVFSGIEDIVANEKAIVGIYNLAGQKLAAPVKGLNIINGKKYFVK